MNQHYHQHDYGLGRLLVRGYKGFMLLFVLWALIVAAFTWPQYVFLSIALVIIAVLYFRERRRT